MLLAPGKSSIAGVRIGDGRTDVAHDPGKTDHSPLPYRLRKVIACSAVARIARLPYRCNGDSLPKRAIRGRQEGPHAYYRRRRGSVRRQRPWEEYTYPEYAFSVTFPAKPQV